MIMMIYCNFWRWCH